MTTYGDMVTLLLCFFVLLMNPEAPPESQRMELIMYAFQGLGPLQGGNTLEIGQLAELGHNVTTMPSARMGTGLNEARKEAVSLLQPEIRSQTVRVKQDERGLIISLASDVFFEPASADLNLEAARDTLQRVAGLLSRPDLSERKFRIEGHTDNTPTDPEGPWRTNWELSAARSAEVLHFLVDFGATEEQFQIAGFADTVPLQTGDTEEDRQYNRRVDIVILAEGHL